MATTYIFPTSAEILKISQEKLPRLTADRPIFDLLPVRDVDDHMLVWEQKDNYLGLQQVRGLDGMPARVKKVGIKRYEEEPGVYGEFIDLDEVELTRRRQIGTWATPVDLSDLVMDAQDQLLQRRLDRIEQIGWTLLGTGTFSVAAPNGAVVHTGSYTTQTFSSNPVWSTAATATPLADFRAVQLLGPAKGASFGSGARAYMNRTTFNRFVANSNDADLGRLLKLPTGEDSGRVLSVAEMNKITMGADLPGIVIYDEGYFNDAGTFVRYIANGTVIVVGQRPGGQRVGEYRMTRNVNNPDMGPGAYMKVIDSGEVQVPRRVDVHDGHNGGPVLYFPGSIVVMTVG